MRSKTCGLLAFQNITARSRRPFECSRSLMRTGFSDVHLPQDDYQLVLLQGRLTIRSQYKDRLV